jgi:transposase
MTPGPIRGAGIMGQAIEITRHEHSAADLRRLAGKCGDAEVVRRLLALAAVLDGASRAEAARHAGMDRQTLRAWVHRHNAEGLAGLRSRQSPGRAPVLSKEQLQELKALVIDGPDPETHKVVRWRCCDLRAGVARRFRVEVHERTVGKWLRALLTRLQPRPCHPKRDLAARELFKNLPRAGERPSCGGRNRSARLDRGGERPIGFWWW